MFTRIAIVNRGEAARRLIHAVRELNAALEAAPDGRRASPIQTVALYTDGERHATFVREADLAYCLGPASARPYLDLEVLERALRETGADSAWVGWGFVAEDPAFADLCERLGVVFIGPGAAAMRKLGDKIGSKLIAEEVGVPVAPWSRGPVEDIDSALATAEEIGYPLMLKATAGGGGRGIRVVASAAELREAYARTSAEAARAFGSGVVFLERLVTGARHVEVQVIADGHGTAWALGVRDCSIQRRNQKIIEESASPVLDADQVRTLKDSAERLAAAVGYCGACTVEFLYHPGERFFAFLEVNTRLQVEHPITEATTGVDLVKMQLEVAAGLPLIGERPVERGHAVEARLNAEDPDRDFAPAPGRIALLRLPTGPGVRVDTGVTEGDVIPPDFDSMIAKIIAVGRDRKEALARLRRAVADTTVIIEGGATNKSFVLALLDEPAVIEASADTGWVDRVRDEGRLVAHRHMGIALTMAAIDGYGQVEEGERIRLWDSGRGGRPHVRHEVGRAVDLKLGERGYRVAVARTGADGYRIRIDDHVETVELDAHLERIDAHHSRLIVAGRTYRVASVVHGPVHMVEVDGVAHRVSRDEGGVLRAPAPALVVATPVAEGGEVAAGAPVLVLESMKMETVLRAPFEARVRELLVSVGGQVAVGTPLARLEPLGDGPADTDPQPAGVDLMIPVPGADAAVGERVSRTTGEIRGLLLGFDSFDETPKTALAHYLAGRDELFAVLGSAGAAEIELAAIFADLAELSAHAAFADHDGAEIRSPREQLHIYLQSLDLDRGGLTDAFRRTMTRVLGHYGIVEPDRSTALEEAVFRIFLAIDRQRLGSNVMTALLKLWITEPAPAAELHDRTRDVLDRLIRLSQNRFPAVADLARSVAYRWYLRPEAKASRAAALAGVATELEVLANEPDGADRAARIARLVDIPESLDGLFADRITAPAAREPMLEIAARLHYGMQQLNTLRAFDIGGRPFVVCDYRLELRPNNQVPTTSVAAIGRFEDLTEFSSLTAGLRAELAGAPDAHVRVVDLYLFWPDAPGSEQERADALRSRLVEVGLHHDARRIVIGVTTGYGRLEHFTFRRAEDGLKEDIIIRGVHPLVGRRLSLWALSDFHITRIPTPEALLLFHCVARENDTDQRLIALAQVSRFDVTHDADGRITEIAGVDTVLNACLEAIGRARHELDPSGRLLDMNVVALDIRPTVRVDPDELAAWQRATAPRVAQAGIEEILMQGRIIGDDGSEREALTHLSYEPGGGVAVSVSPVLERPLVPLDDYGKQVLLARRRNTVHPYELIGLLTGTTGEFTEYDLDDQSRLAPVDRPRGHNKSGIVAGIVTTPTPSHPEGIRRVVLLGDPTKALGAVSEAECARIIAALDLAQQQSIPVEWYALSAGARISMESGTENMDWVARALRRIVHFTQDGGEINIVVAGINVGAQPYWNAEATMLMHTKGILVMTPASAMVLTGKQSLDFSGGVSAEDNFGIGGYARVMGPNGQAQYWAPNLAGARDIVMAHYAFTYIAPGETSPRRAVTADPVDRDISGFPHQHPDSDFSTVGEIFSVTANPDRKKPFDIRTVMRAVADQDHPLLERWPDMADADTAVTADARIDGRPVCLIGIESRTVARHGFPPADGPDIYTAGTLFPRSSKKVARALNSASGNRPAVVLANLSGFDGSPESMRTLQLEYGAEIGRAIVNFEGPIVFCVISRYHGGAFVVFSKALNPNMTVFAIAGSYASVIGGAPAAAVVFARTVDARTNEDPRVKDLEQRTARADESEKPKLRTQLVDTRAAVRAEKLATVAAEFDGVHTIERAVDVGSVDAVIQAAELRPKIAAALNVAPDRKV